MIICIRQLFVCFTKLHTIRSFSSKYKQDIKGNGSNQCHNASLVTINNSTNLDIVRKYILMT